MAYSWTDLLCSGGQTILSFNFPYLSRNHIHVFRVDSSTGQPFEFFDFTFTSTYTIQIAGGAFDGEVIRIQRLTPIDAALIDYTNGSSLHESLLDTQYNHLVFVLQERLDQEQVTLRLNSSGIWDFGGRQATGLLTTQTIENIQVQHNGGNLPLKPIVNFNDSDSLVFDVAHNPANNRIDVSGTIVLPEPDAPLEDLTARTITDSTAETLLGSVTIPAGRMGNNSRLVIESLITFQNDSSVDRYLELSVYAGGSKISTTQYQFSDLGSFVHHVLVTARLQNLASLTSQMAWGKAERMGSGSITSSFELGGLLSINTASSFNVEIKGQLLDANTLQVVTHRGTKVIVQ